MSLRVRNAYLTLGEIPMISLEGLIVNYDSDLYDLIDPGLDCSDGGPGAKQSFKDECDINRIMAQSEATGIATWVNERSPQFGEFEEFDFQVAMNTVAKASEMFEALPSGVRKRFHNDPAELLEFLQDKENLAEAVKLGLCVPPKVEAVPEPVSVRIIADPVVKTE